MRPAALAGKWLVSADLPGKGRYAGSMVITPKGDDFTTTITLKSLKDGSMLTRTGSGIVYSGYSWRGTSKGAGGPSAGYGARVSAKVKPNIAFPDDIDGNPRAEVEVRAAPDGTIVGVRVVKSSGNAAWDQAVVRALHKTDTLPKDVDGTVPSNLVIGFRPKD